VDCMIKYMKIQNTILSTGIIVDWFEEWWMCINMFLSFSSLLKIGVKLKLVFLQNRGIIFGSQFGGSYWKYCGTILKIVAWFWIWFKCHIFSSIICPQTLNFLLNFKLYLCFEYLEYWKHIWLLLDWIHP